MNVYFVNIMISRKFEKWKYDEEVLLLVTKMDANFENRSIKICIDCIAKSFMYFMFIKGHIIKDSRKC